MIVYDKNNVAFTASGIVFKNGPEGKKNFENPDRFAKTVPGTNEVMGKIAMWGSSNLLPQEMAADIEATGVLSAAIDAKARIALGKGPYPARIIGLNDDGYEQLKFEQDSEIQDWLEMNNAYEYGYKTLRDMFGYGNAFTQILLSQDRTKIWGFKREDPAECRFEKISEASQRIHNVYMSGDWSMYSSPGEGKDPRYATIPLLDRDYPLYDLMSRTSGHNYMLSLQYALNGRKYYAPSPWYAAKRWVKIAQGVPEMKEAMFKNQMTIKYLIDIHPEFWSVYDSRYDTANDDLKKSIVKDLYKKIDEYLVGGNNAYKSLVSTMVTDKATNEVVPGIKVTALDDKIKDGKLLPDSAAANIEILLPLMINSALFGVDMPGGAAYGGGAGSGSNIREGYLVQVMLVEFERRQISKIFDIAKRMNGWDKSLVLRYPNQILTTLNTGKNTQPTA